MAKPSLFRRPIYPTQTSQVAEWGLTPLDGAQGKVGPTIQSFAARVYISGIVIRSPDNLIQWIENPRSIDAKSAMPITGISRAETMHAAAYLYMLL